MSNSKIYTTRFQLLGYRCEAPKQWSIVDLETNAAIGPKYTSKDELLADLSNFATIRGYSL